MSFCDSVSAMGFHYSGMFIGFWGGIIVGMILSKWLIEREEKGGK